MNADDCEMEAKILRAAMDASVVQQNRALFGTLAREWDGAADDLRSAEALGDPAHVGFIGSVVRGQRILKDGWYRVARRTVNGSLQIDDPEAVRPWFVDRYWEASPIVVFGEGIEEQ